METRITLTRSFVFLRALFEYSETNNMQVSVGIHQIRGLISHREPQLATKRS